MYRKRTGKSYSQRRPVQARIPFPGSAPGPSGSVNALMTHLQSLKQSYGGVRLAILANQATGLLNYRVRATTREGFEEMLDAIRAISVNEFYGPKVAMTLKDLAEEGLIASVEFGAEGTPVIYISPPFWKHQSILGATGKNRKYTEAERREMLKRIIEGMKDAEPDELFVVDMLENPVDPDDPSRDPSLMRVRAWWD